MINRRRRDSDSSDQSPPRKKPTKSNSQHSRFDSDHQEDKQGKATKTLSGAKAGLSSAKEMLEEAKKLREKEERSFQNVSAIDYPAICHFIFGAYFACAYLFLYVMTVICIFQSVIRRANPGRDGSAVLNRH